MANPVLSGFETIIKDLEIRVEETEGLDVAADEDIKKLSNAHLSQGKS